VPTKQKESTQRSTNINKNANLDPEN